MTRLIRFAAPLLLSAGAADTAAAGWNNVYQVTCFRCRTRPARTDSAYYPPAPSSSRSSNFAGYQTETRSETVTVMKPQVETVMVPTTERRSYYEPITTHTRSSYYNPVTGCCETVDVPKTSFRLKTDCSTVMKPVERLRMVPEQVVRQYEVRRPIFIGPEERVYKQPECPLPGASSGSPPQVDVIRSQPPAVSDGQYIAPQQMPTNPGGVSQPRPLPPARVNARTTSRTGGPTVVRGEVVRADQTTPLGGAKLVLVSAADSSVREFVTADEFGRFDTQVPAGTWHLYVGDGSGKAGFHKTVKLDPSTERQFAVVSR